MSDDESKARRHFYDVERFRRIHAETQHRRGRFARIIGRITGFLSSIQGILTTILLPLVIVFGSVIAIVYGLYFGPLVFFGMVGIFFVGVAVIGERKFGSSLQFSHSNFLRKILAQILGSTLALVFVFFILVFSGIIHL